MTKKGYIINYTEKENNINKDKTMNVVASNMKSAIETTGLVESDDIVLKNALLIKEGLEVEESDVPESATLAINIENDVVFEDTNNQALPSVANAHEGDVISIKAVCDNRYDFVGWFKNGIFISSDISINYTLSQGANVIVAKFALKEINIETTQSVGGSCFCSVAKAKNGDTVGFAGIAANGYIFEHFELNGENIGTQNPRNITIVANDEMKIEVKAVFIAQ